jgi:hypothetical protein
MLEPRRRDQGLAQQANLADSPSRQELLDGDVAAELAIVDTRHATETAAAVLRDDLVAVTIAELRGGDGARFIAGGEGGLGGRPTLGDRSSVGLAGAGRVSG